MVQLDALDAADVAVLRAEVLFHGARDGIELRRRVAVLAALGVHLPVHLVVRRPRVHRVALLGVRAALGQHRDAERHG